MSRVLVIGDTHCPAMHPKYPGFLSRIHRKYKCTRVVHIGDLVDNAAISYHEKSPSASSAEEEYRDAKKQVQRLYKAFPKVDWLIGNHDALTERQAVSAGMPVQTLRDYPDLWDVPGWTVTPRFGRLQIDGVIYAHGDSGLGGMYSAVKNSRQNFHSYVCGHHHQEAGIWWTQVQNCRVFGMNTGTGCDPDSLAFEYGRKFNKRPMLGCGVVLDGLKAYFEPM